MLWCYCTYYCMVFCSYGNSLIENWCQLVWLLDEVENNSGWQLLSLKTVLTFISSYLCWGDSRSNRRWMHTKERINSTKNKTNKNMSAGWKGTLIKHPPFSWRVCQPFQLTHLIFGILPPPCASELQSSC